MKHTLDNDPLGTEITDVVVTKVTAGLLITLFHVTHRPTLSPCGPLTVGVSHGVKVNGEFDPTALSTIVLTPEAGEEQYTEIALLSNSQYGTSQFLLTEPLPHVTIPVVTTPTPVEDTGVAPILVPAPTAVEVEEVDTTPTLKSAKKSRPKKKSKPSTPTETSTPIPSQEFID